MTYSPETEKTDAIRAYYELSKTVVFWTNVCLVLFVFVTGKYSIVVRIVEETARRIVWMVRGKPLDFSYFEEDTVSVRQRRVRERNEVDRRVMSTAWERRMIALSAGRHRSRLYDWLEKAFGFRSDVAETDYDRDDRPTQPSRTAGLDSRIFRNLNAVAGGADPEPIDGSSQTVCAKCRQSIP